MSKPITLILLAESSPGQLRGAHHADDAAGRAGEDRVLALERLGVGQAAVRLHEDRCTPGISAATVST